MVKTEGFLSIYKGLSASLVREASYSALRFGLYDFCKDSCANLVPSVGKDSFGIKLAGGLASGMMGAAVANPADLLKVRMQSFGAAGTLRSYVSSIFTQDGLAGLYRGVWPTTLRAGILTSSQLGVYDQAKQTLLLDFPTVFQEGFMTHFAASGIAGLACSAASSPVDVVKVRVMSDKTHRYKSAIHCAGTLLRTEGPFAFYKGFSMCFLRLWPQSVLCLLFFEQLRKAAGIPPI